MSIFPFIDAPADQQQEDVKLPKEWAWNFENNDFKLRDGKPYIVEGKEAVKIWVYKALKTDRYRYMAYSWDYGQNLENLIGKGYSKGYIDSEVKRYLEECLRVNPNITAVKNIEVKFEKDKLNIDFEIETPYGEVRLSV